MKSERDARESEQREERGADQGTEVLRRSIGKNMKVISCDLR